ncbi:putative graves disease carrier protein-like isoform X1 [Apostichopus japonicus]|uniref:Putative graves disease carrier protein-like isoform X1 n=1 Tax=Stichopus japonicus TaxID=307972 RepID=A0A2G8JPP2_STIJA|nr:putative graves disease carrier protein-like isoform X1 [Apostichopus japonicus]
MMVRIFPYGAIQFTTYEWFKQKTKRKLLSGSLAGMCAVITTYPLDMVRARLAYQVKGQHLYRGIFHAAQSIWQQEGRLRALYRGVTPTLIGMIPYAGTAFYSYEVAKSFIITNGPVYLTRMSTTDSNVQMLTPLANLMAGAFAGAVAQTISYPLDVVRRMMQLGEMVPHYTRSSLEILTYVFKKYGMRGLYRGLTINYLRAVPTAAVSFTVYEYMKEVLDVQTRK